MVLHTEVMDDEEVDGINCDPAAVLQSASKGE
jgi:hypothetical protein